VLIKPSPLPDEFALGLLGRFVRLNGCPPTNVPKLLNSFVTTPSPSHGQILSGLAAASNMDLSEFVHRHTLIPFLCAIARDSAQSRPPGVHSANILTRNAMRKDVLARFCRQCVADDERTYGFAYWRRCHQVPGVEFCAHHGASLIHVRRDEPFEISPSESREDASTFVSEKFEPRHLKTIHRYSEIAFKLLSRSQPIRLSITLEVLRARATDLDIRHGTKGVRRSIADVARELCSAPWLRTHFTSRNGEKPDGVSSSLENILRNSVIPLPAHYYVLASALLFEGAEEALVALDCPKVSVFKRPEPPKKIDWAGSQVVSTYIQSKGSLTEVARVLGTNPTHTYLKLTAIGLPSMFHVVGTSLGDALIDFYEGATLRQACEAHDVSMTEIEDILRKASALFSHSLLAIHGQEIDSEAASKAQATTSGLARDSCRRESDKTRPPLPAGPLESPAVDAI
jgi:TniQ